MTDQEPRAEIWTALGAALTEWSYLESVLCRTFCAALTVRYDKPAIAAFNAIYSFEGKLLTVNRAVEALRLGEGLNSKWVKIYNKLGAENKKRNQLAHCYVIVSPQTKAVPYLSLAEAVSNHQSGIDARYDGLTADQILARRKSFKETAGKLGDFTHDILGKHGFKFTHDLDDAKQWR